MSPLASKLVEAPLRRGLVLGPTFLVEAERPEVIDIVDKSFVLLGISIHIPSGLFFEVVELVFLNVLPNAADLLHDVQGGNVRVITHHLGPRLNFLSLDLKANGLRWPYLSNEEHVGCQGLLGSVKRLA